MMLLLEIVLQVVVNGFIDCLRVYVKESCLIWIFTEPWLIIILLRRHFLVPLASNRSCKFIGMAVTISSMYDDIVFAYSCKWSQVMRRNFGNSEEFFAASRSHSLTTIVQHSWTQTDLLLYKSSTSFPCQVPDCCRANVMGTLLLLPLLLQISVVSALNIRKL